MEIKEILDWNLIINFYCYIKVIWLILKDKLSNFNNLYDIIILEVEKYLDNIVNL